ncbi:DUF4124 domain-containing protein [Chitinimonas sp. BJYL2]|uniref:DUF4124 domain-containing protein n=1 Tax=Chitinimonas sp. BJYL2 TaxID=2976696 RepID=UPI0022B46777|nr:DUF4124 domain-containing protein [Chitinimonas sp. BJYL2]
MLFRHLIPTSFAAPATALILVLPAAHADIYKHVDAEGRVTYSNIPIKGANKLDLGPSPMSVPAPRPRSGTSSGAPRASATPTPGYFPRVDSATQRQRDMTKLQILQDEMNGEQRLLDAARQKYAANPSDPRQRENVLMHEKNIEALRKEMSRVQ